MSTSRKNIMLGTAGHVDHGKTSLVKLLTGCNTDRLAEEQQRGLTIELGFAPCRMADDRIVGIVDVPGHVGFIRNMVAGAHGIDVVILVVAADDGVMPQTREHLDILTMMGVKRGLVALTKIDLVDEEFRELAAEDVRDHVRGTFLDGAPICPVSNVTGEGFDFFFRALKEVVEACDAHPTESLFRLWIERTFSVKGFGVVVSGIPAGGEVRVGEMVTLQPGREKGRVRGLEVYGEDADIGRAGECVAMNISGLDHDKLQRGMLLCAFGAYDPVEVAEAELSLLPGISDLLKHQAEVHLHVGTAHVMAKVAMLEANQMEPGETGLVQLRLNKALPLAIGERFVIRAGMSGTLQGQLTTIGGGRILGTSNERLRRSRPGVLDPLMARRAALGDSHAWVRLILKEAGQPIAVADLSRLAQMPERSVAQILEQLAHQTQVSRLEDHRYLHHEILCHIEHDIRKTLTTFHASQPTRLGMPVAELTQTLAEDHASTRFTLKGMMERGDVVQQGAVLALATHEVKVDHALELLCQQISRTCHQAGLNFPTLEEIAQASGDQEADVTRAVVLLMDQGVLVKLDGGMYIHRETMTQAAEVVRALFNQAGGFTTAEYRDALGVSRKYVIPLLDYFDQARLTVRNGNRRTPGTQCEAMDVASSATSVQGSGRNHGCQ